MDWGCIKLPGYNRLLDLYYTLEYTLPYTFLNEIDYGQVRFRMHIGLCFDLF